MLNPRRFRGKNVAAQDLVKRWKILKGDHVAVTQGPNKGERGKVIRVIRNRNLAVVEGANITKRGVKKGLGGKSESLEPQFTTGPSPIHYSKLALIDPSDNKPCKIEWKFSAEGKRLRISKRTGTLIPKPKHEFKLKELHKAPGPKDTDPEIAAQATFDPETLNPIRRVSQVYREWNLGSIPQDHAKDSL